MKFKKNMIVGLMLTGLLITASIVALTGCDTSQAAGDGLSGTITEAGSTTVQPLAEKFAEEFKQMNPGITVTIQGGGSSVGIKSAIDGTVDIGAASRELKTDEAVQVVAHVIAKDGIAIVTHADNPMEGLTKDQVKEIFMGKITNWRQVGGSDDEIHVVAREEGSGTRGAFEEMVMGEDLITATAILQNSNGAVRTTVAGDPQAIAFLSFGYLDQTVKAMEIGGVVPTIETALDGTYPIVRPLLFVTRSEPQGLVKSFIDFCLGAEGQKIVEEEGYIPVR